ncbi:MAG: hypothetical protein VKK59_01995 [Vampirovibrionales bacterium]|nr:hypothetical protein [Vampirovibrionales bacterium]
MLHWLQTLNHQSDDDITDSVAQFRGQTSPMFKQLLKPALAILNQPDQSEDEFLGAQFVLMANGLL